MFGAQPPRSATLFRPSFRIIVWMETHIRFLLRVGEDQETRRHLGKGPDIPTEFARILQRETQRSAKYVKHFITSNIPIFNRFI